MEEIAILSKSGNRTHRDLLKNNNGSKYPYEQKHINPVIDNLLTQGGENFLEYIKWHGLANEYKMLVLPSDYHYYYEEKELRDIKVIINLKKLNLIAHLDSFTNTVCKVVSPKTNLIGCFTDRKSSLRDGLLSRMYRKFINFLDLKIDNEIDNKDVKRLLETHGFKLLDMTEINGLTYFRAQNSAI